MTLPAGAGTHCGMRCLHSLLLGSVLLTASACSDKQEKSTRPASQTSAPASLPARPFTEAKPKLTFDHDVSAILAAEDDYVRALSAFDYAAKFKSDKPLTEEQRRLAYRAALQQYTPQEVERLRAAFETTFIAMSGMTTLMPETIHVFSEETIESGAAYTRANVICLPKRFIARLDTEQLQKLVAHEVFHVISRHNPDLRPEIYAILGFEPVPPLSLPEPLAGLTIANPDAPGMDYAIAGLWRGQGMRFVPILHSDRAYTGGSFFEYLRDDLLVVSVLHDRTEVVQQEGQALIVKKEDVEGYYEQVGRNTGYTFHPEETSADHFMHLLLSDIPSLPNPDKVRALGDILRR